MTTPTSDTALASELRATVIRLARRLRNQRADESMSIGRLPTLGHPGPARPADARRAGRARAGPAAVDDADHRGARGGRAGHPHRPPHRPPPGPGRAVTARARRCSSEDRRRRDAWLAQRMRELDPDDLAVLRQAAAGAAQAGRLVSPMFRSLANRNYRLFATGQVISPVRHLGPAGGAGLAGAADRPQGPRGRRPGHHDRPAVPADAAVRPVRRSAGRPLRQAPAAHRRAGGDGSAGAGPRACSTSPASSQLWHVYLLAFGLGLASVVDTPARQSFVSELVGTDDLPNAVSLNSATFNSARIVGPALAGLAISGVGTGWVFIANALTYVAVLAGLVRMRPAEFWTSPRAAAASGPAAARALRHVRQRPELYVPILLVFMIGTFGLNFQQTLALIAKQTFHTGAGSFGLLTSALAVGSLLGALGQRPAQGPAAAAARCCSAALAFGLLEVADGLAPTFLTMALLLIPTGVRGAGVHHDGQLAGPARPARRPLRGRVMAIYVLVFLGGTPVGAPLVGCWPRRSARGPAC